MSILSIQSHVSYGHAGNSSAVFPLQRLGFEVWPIHTVHFSNHSGYPTIHGDITKPEQILDIFEGIFKVVDPSECQAILTGYIGAAPIADAVKTIVTELKKKNPTINYFCDPVMGDIGRGIFVAEGIPEKLKTDIIPITDFIFPNHFELELITDKKITTYQEAKLACQDFFDQGTKAVILTSFLGSETKENHLDILAITPDKTFKITTPIIPRTGHLLVGTGDLIAALFTGNYLKTNSVKEALEQATMSIFDIIKKTIQTESRELALIQAQDFILKPESVFTANLI